MFKGVKQLSKSGSYKKGGGGTTNLYEDCKNNIKEDGIPMDPIGGDEILSENKIVLGNACYNKESLCE